MFPYFWKHPGVSCSHILSPRREVSLTLSCDFQRKLSNKKPTESGSQEFWQSVQKWAPSQIAINEVANSTPYKWPKKKWCFTGVIYATDRVQKAPFMTGDGAHLVAVPFILHLFSGREYFGAHLFFFFSTPSIEDQFFIHQSIFAHENRWKPLPIDDSYITLGQWSYRKHRCSRRFYATQPKPSLPDSEAMRDHLVGYVHPDELPRCRGAPTGSDGFLQKITYFWDQTIQTSSKVGGSFSENQRIVWVGNIIRLLFLEEEWW